MIDAQLNIGCTLEVRNVYSNLNNKLTLRPAWMMEMGQFDVGRFDYAMFDFYFTQLGSKLFIVRLPKIIVIDVEKPSIKVEIT